MRCVLHDGLESDVKLLKLYGGFILFTHLFNKSTFFVISFNVSFSRRESLRTQRSRPHPQFYLMLPYFGNTRNFQFVNKNTTGISWNEDLCLSRRRIRYVKAYPITTKKLKAIKNSKFPALIFKNSSLHTKNVSSCMTSHSKRSTHIPSLQLKRVSYLYQVSFRR